MAILFVFPIKTFAFNPNADNTDVFVQYQNSIIYVHPDAADEDIQSYISVYHQLPSNVIKCLTQSDIKIYAMPYKGPDPGNETICAMAYPPLYEVDSETKKIIGIKRSGWIVCYTDLRQKYFNPEQLMYAIGCELDYITAYPDGYYSNFSHGISDSKEWNQIYNVDNKEALAKVREYDSLTQLNWPLTAADGFADAFRLYVCHNEDLQQVSDMVFTFMDTYIPNVRIYHIPKSDISDIATSDNDTPVISEEPSQVSETEESLNEPSSKEEIVPVKVMQDIKPDVPQEEIKTLTLAPIKIPKSAFSMWIWIRQVGKSIRSALINGLNTFITGISTFWNNLTLFHKLIPVIIIIVYQLIVRIKQVISNKRTSKQKEKYILDRLKNAKIHDYNEINTWHTQKPVYGCYILTNPILKVNKVAVSHDLFNDILTQIKMSGETIHSINRARTRQYWQVRYILLAANIDEIWLSKTIKSMSLH